MKKVLKPLNFIVVLLTGIVGTNIFIAWQRETNSYKEFKEPISVGAKVSLDFLQSGKEKVILHVKPGCPACKVTKPVINSLYQKFGKQVDFIALFPQGYEDKKDLLGLEFEAKPYDAKMFNSLHFKFTPQVVVVKEGIVTFRFDFNEGGFDVLFKNLENYLSKNYDEAK